MPTWGKQIQVISLGTLLSSNFHATVAIKKKQSKDAKARQGGSEELISKTTSKQYKLMWEEASMIQYTENNEVR